MADYEIGVSSPVKQAVFSRYADVDEAGETEYYLLANRGLDGGTLVPEMRYSDYFLLIHHFIDEEDLELLLEQLVTIEEVVAASEISPQKLKSKENLVF